MPSHGIPFDMNTDKYRTLRFHFPAGTGSQTTLIWFVAVFSASSLKMLISQNTGYVVFTLNRFGVLRPRFVSVSKSSSGSSTCWKFDSMRSAQGVCQLRSGRYR